MVRPERFELPAFWFVARRSIQLSYGRTPSQDYSKYCGEGSFFQGESRRLSPAHHDHRRSRRTLQVTAEWISYHRRRAGKLAAVALLVIVESKDTIS